MSETDKCQECERFPGRLRDLCEGRPRDGRAAVQMRDAVQFRLSQGLSPTPPYTNADAEHPVWESPPAKKQLRGMGDVIEICLSKIGVKKRRGCGCSRRQRLLNKLLPNPF